MEILVLQYRLWATPEQLINGSLKTDTTESSIGHAVDATSPDDNVKQEGTERLLQHLLNQQYDVAARPASSKDGPVTVFLGIALRQLIQVDERNQIISAAVWMRQYWTDPHLSWNPEDYNDTSEIHIPEVRHWKPDLVLYNNAAETFASQLEGVITLVNHTGWVTFMFPATYRFSCDINVQDFPFDQQSCDIKFGSWAYSAQHLDLQLKDTHPADLTNYHYDSEWGLVQFSVTRNRKHYGCCEDDFIDVTFHLTIRRRYALYCWYLIIPTVIISVMATLQFLLPCDSGEKITLGITVLLSLIVFLLLMADILPITENVPLIARYMSATLVMVGISQVITILTLRVHHNGAHDNHLQMPGWVRRYVLHGLARLLRMNHLITDDEEHVERLQVYDSHTSVEVEPSGEEEVVMSRSLARVKEMSVPCPPGSAPVAGGEDEQTDPSKHSKTSINFYANQRRRSSVVVRQSSDLILAKILQQLEQFHYKQTEAGRHEEVSSEWQQLAMVLDRLFLYIYLMVSLLIILIVFTNRTWYHQDILI